MQNNELPKIHVELENNHNVSYKAYHIQDQHLQGFHLRGYWHRAKNWIQYYNQAEDLTV